MRKTVISFALMCCGLLLSGCAELTIAWADLEPEGVEAAPAALGPFAGAPAVETRDAWRARRAGALRDALQKYVYGYLPDASATRVLEKRRLDDAAFAGKGVLEEWTMTAAATFSGVAVETRPVVLANGFPLEVVFPRNAAGPAPVIVMETFCPSWDVVPDPAVSRPEGAEPMGGGLFGALMTYVFGRHICTPPFAAILEQGYAVAVLHPVAIPDRREEGLAELRRLSAGHEDETTRWGAVAAWAWLYSRVYDALAADPRVDPGAVVVWGHSRYGKSALLAAAFDARIAGAIAHQSGAGGASLNRDKPGESVEQVTANYPHWFARSYARHAGREGDHPVDQHMLLALIAPRPVFLGNARRDVWSDPNGAFRAAQGATPAYRLHGAQGLTAARLDDFRPGDEIAFWTRPGTHGVVKEDWPAFLEFLDAHFGRRAGATAADVSG
jgi:hypothetical protein